MTTDKEFDAVMRVTEQIIEIMRDYAKELEGFGQEHYEAVFNSHLPVFSIINYGRTIIKQKFDPEALEFFDELIDKLKIDTEAH